MALQEKYQQLTEEAKQANVTDLSIQEQEGVLYISGIAPTAAIKDGLWDTYNKLDPDFASGDVVLDIKVSGMVAGNKARVTTTSSNLNIRKGPGTDQPVVGKAAHDEVVTLLSKTSDQWWLIKTNDAKEGYAFAEYLTPLTK
jgi:uncharacterized protein YgiM (DUF1202 family)